MARKKFTVFLLPDDDQYQVVIPHFPDCITYGPNIKTALKNAEEALTLRLEGVGELEGDPLPSNAHVPHVVVAEIEADVPANLIVVKNPV